MLINSVLCVYGSILKYSSRISTNKTAEGEEERPFILETADIIKYVAFIKSKSLMSSTKCHSAKHQQSFRMMNGLPVDI